MLHLWSEVRHNATSHHHAVGREATKTASIT